MRGSNVNYDDEQFSRSANWPYQRFIRNRVIQCMRAARRTCSKQHSDSRAHPTRDARAAFCICIRIGRDDYGAARFPARAKCITTGRPTSDVMYITTIRPSGYQRQHCLTVRQTQQNIFRARYVEEIGPQGGHITCSFQYLS